MHSAKFKSPRSAIRQKIADKLSALVQGRVFLSRVSPLPQNALPGLTVFVARDELNQHYMTMSEQDGACWHTLTVVVQVHVLGNKSIDESIDSLEAQVCHILSTDPTLGGLVMRLRWLSTDLQLSGEGTKIAGVADLSFEIIFKE